MDDFAWFHRLVLPRASLGWAEDYPNFADLLIGARRLLSLAEIARGEMYRPGLCRSRLIGEL